jgi:hypothetical protein
VEGAVKKVGLVWSLKGSHGKTCKGGEYRRRVGGADRGTSGEQENGGTDT